MTIIITASAGRRRVVRGWQYTRRALYESLLYKFRVRRETFVRQTTRVVRRVVMGRCGVNVRAPGTGRDGCCVAEWFTRGRAIDFRSPASVSIGVQTCSDFIPRVRRAHSNITVPSARRNRYGRCEGRTGSTRSSKSACEVSIVFPESFLWRATPWTYIRSRAEQTRTDTGFSCYFLFLSLTSYEVCLFWIIFRKYILILYS